MKLRLDFDNWSVFQLSTIVSTIACIEINSFDDIYRSVFARPCNTKHAGCNATLLVLSTGKWQVHCSISMVSKILYDGQGTFSHVQSDLVPLKFAYVFMSLQFLYLCHMPILLKQNGYINVTKVLK